ncbi:MAG: maltose alpha-D-glucosyltransferase [Desulfovibrionaceae bacterium]
MSTKASQKAEADPQAQNGAPADAVIDSKADPLWYKDAVIYELHVKAFCDSDGNGIGDFAGLASKLDYLQDLGVTALWLLPFFPSPLRDDGYDAADYVSVHPDYGTMRDLKMFLREAKRRGLRVITELVLNHTSDQHPWFQRARRAKPGSAHRNFYVWSGTPDRYTDARIIFQDFETSNWTWDPVAKAYYWHRFYAHQPDLNFDNPQVRKVMLGVIDFWFDLGVDGVRLDAVPYLFEREGTNCENLPETYAFLRELRAHVDARYPGRMLLAEANQWPEDAVAYFGDGDMCHMAFHFPIMPRLFMALRMEDRHPVVDILDQTPAIPDNCQWALFLRNHDELTLEMVTDEERDYMYRVYADDPQARINLGIRRRLAPLLSNHRRRLELLNALLMSLPGAPVLYYGDEIGMGDNIYLGDRNGVRTPMQWSADRNAGFSRCNPQKLYLPTIIDPEYHFETVNVEAQQNNPHSLLWWTRRLIAMRKRYKAFSRGSLAFLTPENRKIMAFVRTCGGERILVVANLSRFVQYAELDLSAFRGQRPVEVFGRTEFPTIGDAPYFLTLGPHTFYWFELTDSPQLGAWEGAGQADDLPSARLQAETNWREVFGGKERRALEEALIVHVPGRSWFSGRGRILHAAVRHGVDMWLAEGDARLCLVRVEYKDADAETYAMALGFASGEAARRAVERRPASVVARLRLAATGEEGVLFDMYGEREFCQELLLAMAHRRVLRGGGGKLAPVRTPAFRRMAMGLGGLGAREPVVDVREQGNTVALFGEQFALKLLRRMEPVTNPELEAAWQLAGRGFAHVPALAGAVEFRRESGGVMTLAVVQGYVPNQGSALDHVRDALVGFFEHVLSRSESSPPDTPDSLFAPIPDVLREILAAPAANLELVRQLGRHAAALHCTLADAAEGSPFAPEPFSKLYQRSLYQAYRSLTARVLEKAARHAAVLPQADRDAVPRLLGAEGAMLDQFHLLVGERLDGMRIRCHGMFTLEHVLIGGRDLTFIDFDGDPACTLHERRIKRSPLRDVAAMLYSFHRVAQDTLEARGGAGGGREAELLAAWLPAWLHGVGHVFLDAYLQHAPVRALLPEGDDEMARLLAAYGLEKALLELERVLTVRPGAAGGALRLLVRQLGG